MKSLSKLHQEAILKARNETDQNKAAAMAMIEKPLELIKAIMLKHEIAVMEVIRELHESREAAVRAERQCIKREWVGLTDEEMLALIAYEPHPLANKTAIINAVERILKEKNT